MIRRTLGSVRNEIAKVTQEQLCSDSPVVRELTNQAQERLLNKGKWAGTKARYQFCAYDGCVALPRELESILAVNINGIPRRVNSQWFEFLEGGPGSHPGNGWIAGHDLQDRGNAVTFRDICGAKYIRVYCDLNEDTGKRILIRGFDENGNRVQTFVDGSWIDGEYISLEPPYPQVSVNQFTYIESVVKDTTKGFVRLYQFDGVSTQSAIAIYWPDETLPVYRRYAIPGLGNNGTCSAPTGDPKTVLILGKRRFVPAVSDNDDLIITNLGALKAMVMAIEKYDINNIQAAVAYEQLAEKLLDEELKEYNGGNTNKLNIQMRGFAMGGIPRII